MIKHVNLLRKAGKQAKATGSELKSITSSSKGYLKEAMLNIVSELAAKDTTLLNSIKKSFSSATAELNQMHPKLREWAQRPGSFMIAQGYTTKFIIYDGKLYSLGTGSLATDWFTAMTDYASYKIGTAIESKPVANTGLKNRRKVLPSTNLTTFNTKVGSIISTH